MSYKWGTTLNGHRKITPELGCDYSDHERVRTSDVLYYSNFLLARTWTYFGTITFKSVRRDSIYNARQIEDVSLRRGLWCRSFAVSEPHSTGALHYHLLCFQGSREAISENRDKQLWQVESIYNGVFGRSEVSSVRNLNEVGAYVVKYVAKGVDNPQVNYYLMGDWHDAHSRAWVDGKAYY